MERILAFMRAHPEGFSSLDEAAEVIAGYSCPTAPNASRRNAGLPGVSRMQTVVCAGTGIRACSNPSRTTG